MSAARKVLPHAQSHVFADTGHMPQIERADDVTDLLRHFLAAQDGENTDDR